MGKERMVKSLRFQRGFAGWVTAGASVIGAGSALGLFGNHNGPSGAENAAANASADATNRSSAMSQDLFDYYKNTYRPLETSLVSDAEKAGSEQMQEEKAAEAGSTVGAAYDNADKARQLQNDQLGIRPDSGNAQEQERMNSIAKAGSVAGAANTAREAERAYGLNAKIAAADVGKNLPSNAISAENGAANASGIAGLNALRSSDILANEAAGVGQLAGAVGSFARNSNFSFPSFGSGSMGVGSGNMDPTAYNNAVNEANTVYADPNGDVGVYKKGGRVRLPRPPSRTHDYLKGGAVSGPGTGTSDSIPVSIEGKPGALSNGEYVMNAKATKKIGLKRLDRMNLKGLPKGSKMKSGVHVEPTTKLANGGISAQTQAAIKRLDDEDDPNATPRAPEAQPEHTSQGVTAPRPMTPAQQEQLRQLILRRPDANRFKSPQGGAYR